jgi:diaminopimelate decarboxylase
MNCDLTIPTLGYGAAGLQIDDVPLAEIASRFGTPVFVYSLGAMTEAFDAYRNALTWEYCPLLHAWGPDSTSFRVGS